MAVLYKCGLTIKTLDSTRNGMFTHFEHMDCTVVSNYVNVRLCILYRPLPSKRNGFKNIVFFDQWSLYLDRLAVITNDVIISGDRNFHLDNGKAVIRNIVRASYTYIGSRDHVMFFWRDR